MRSDGYLLLRRQTGRFMVFANGKQNSELVNFQSATQPLFLVSSRNAPVSEEEHRCVTTLKTAV